MSEPSALIGQARGPEHLPGLPPALVQDALPPPLPERPTSTLTFHPGVGAFVLPMGLLALSVALMAVAIAAPAHALLVLAALALAAGTFRLLGVLHTRVVVSPAGVLVCGPASARSFRMDAERLLPWSKIVAFTDAPSKPNRWAHTVLEARLCSSERVALRALTCAPLRSASPAAYLAARHALQERLATWDATEPMPERRARVRSEQDSSAA